MKRYISSVFALAASGIVALIRLPRNRRAAARAR